MEKNIILKMTAIFRQEIYAVSILLYELLAYVIGIIAKILKDIATELACFIEESSVFILLQRLDSS